MIICSHAQNLRLFQHRIGVEDSSYSRVHGYSLQKLHMRHPMAWLTWADALRLNLLIWNHTKSIALKLVHQKQPIFSMQVSGHYLLFILQTYRHFSEIIFDTFSHHMLWIIWHSHTGSDDEKAKDDWIGSVGRAIVRCSSTYVSRGKTSQGGGNTGGHTAQNNDGYEDDSDDYSNSSNNPYFNDWDWFWECFPGVGRMSLCTT